jgi:hypothetical protein
MITSSKHIYELTSNTTQSKQLRDRNGYQAAYLSPQEPPQAPPQFPSYNPKEKPPMSQPPPKPPPKPIHLESPPTDSSTSTSFPFPMTAHPSPTNPKAFICPIPTRGHKTRKKLLLRKKPSHNAHQTQKTRITTAGTRQRTHASRRTMRT